MKRIAYRVTLRRIYTGCDYHTTIFLKSPADALARASVRVPIRERNGLRVVSCVPLTPEETAALRRVLLADFERPTP